MEEGNGWARKVGVEAGCGEIHTAHGCSTPRRAANVRKEIDAGEKDLDCIPGNICGWECVDLRRYRQASGQLAWAEDRRGRSGAGARTERLLGCM